MMLFGYTSPTFFQLLAMISIGLFGFLSQLAMPWGYRYAGANEITMYQYLAILFSALTGFLFLHEVQDRYCFFRGMLIVVSAISNYRVTEANH